MNPSIQDLLDKIAVLEYKLGKARDIIKGCCSCDECSELGDCSTCIHDVPSVLRNPDDTDQWKWRVDWIQTLKDVEEDIRIEKEADNEEARYAKEND